VPYPIPPRLLLLIALHFVFHLFSPIGSANLHVWPILYPSLTYFKRHVLFAKPTFVCIHHVLHFYSLNSTFKKRLHSSAERLYLVCGCTFFFLFILTFVLRLFGMFFFVVALFCSSRFCVNVSHTVYLFLFNLRHLVPRSNVLSPFLWPGLWLFSHVLRYGHSMFSLSVLSYFIAVHFEVSYLFPLFGTPIWCLPHGSFYLPCTEIRPPPKMAFNFIFTFFTFFLKRAHNWLSFSIVF